MLTKDLAICIRDIDYSETSQIVTLFTRQAGKLNAIAKGSKRPKSKFGGPIEILSFGEIVFSDSSREKLSTLTEFQQQNLIHAHKDLFALNCCLFGAELINKLTHDFDPHPALFDSFLQFLQNVSKHQSSSIKHQHILRLLILFQLSLLKEIGLQLIFSHCVNCKTRYSAGRLTTEMQNTRYEGYFSSSARGLICRDCEVSFPDKIKLSRKALQCLANTTLLSNIDEKILNEIEKVLIHHLTQTLGYPPKMSKHILGN
jgi:DNA repair protein RecO (recombination protein O)